MELTFIDTISANLNCQYFILNLFSGYLGAVSTTGYYFMFGITTALNHLMGHFSLVVVLAILNRFHWPKPDKIKETKDTNGTEKTIDTCKQQPTSYASDLLLIAMCQVGVSVFQESIHRQTKEGGLYALRSFDFATTVVTLLVLQLKFPQYATSLKHDYGNVKLMILISAFASACWLEPGIYYLENVLYGLLAVPCLAFCQALQIVHMHHLVRQPTSPESLEHCIYDITRTTFGVLIVPAFVCVSDTMELVLFKHLSEWGFLDVFLFSYGFTTLGIYTYSKYWAMSTWQPENYLILRHLKYTLASLGQWYVHDMQFATWYSGVAKVITLILIGIYFVKKFGVVHRMKSMKCE